MSSIVIAQPDDWHIHLRDGEYLETTVTQAARFFRRAVVMPNLSSPVSTTQEAIAYRNRIKAQLATNTCFEPLMTLYLTESLSPEEIKAAKNSGFVYACKLYPAQVTTNSALGVRCIKTLYPVFEAMSDLGILLLIHGEVSSEEADIFDRERLFIEQTLAPLLVKFPKLSIVLEHITTQEAVEFVQEGPDNLAATITAHHLWITRNSLLKNKINPHYYCLPIPQREEDRQALIKAATSGIPKFFIGTDSAPHAKHKKLCSQGCAGIYTAHAAISLYAEVFERAGALSRLEGFLSYYGPKFYRLPVNREKIRLVKRPWQVPEAFDFGKERLIPFQAGQTLQWSVEGPIIEG